MKKSAILFLVIFIFAFFSGCDDDRRDKVSIFYSTYKDDYTNAVRSHLDRKFTDDDIEHTNYNAQGSGEKQLSQIRKAIKEGADIILVNACSEEITEEISREAKESNVPLVYFEKPVSDRAVYDNGAYVVADFSEEGNLQGRAAGKYLSDNYDLCDLNGDGRINYVLYMPTDSESDFIRRMDSSIEKTDSLLSSRGKPAIEFYDTTSRLPYVLCDNNMTEFDSAKEHMLKCIAAFESEKAPLPELVLAMSDSMALGAADALREKGMSSKDKRIPIFGMGGTTSAENAMENGLITGTVKTDTLKMANAIEEITANFLDGDRKFEDMTSYKTENNWKVLIESVAESHGHDL